MNNPAKVKLRFPPSPTGHWHLGGARTALFNWLFARQNGGELVLRIEDTDEARSDQKFEIELVETMKWLGLDWNEGPDWEFKGGEWLGSSRGPNGPYRQSERKDIYRKYLEKLITEKKAYYCYCKPEDLEAEKQSLAAAGLPYKYSGKCRNVSESDTNNAVIRFKVPEVEVEFDDIIRGKVKFDAGLFGDVVIARNLDSPLYNLAVVIDDFLMGITHVIRGEEHLANTPKQILLQQAMAFSTPQYGHLPLILNKDRTKLSKRFAETSMLQYREDGYLPEAMVNFLVLLGWHPSHDKEIFKPSELLNEFKIERVQKAGAIFNSEKLDWLNAQYIKSMPTEELAMRLKPFCQELDLSETRIRELIPLVRERMVTLKDFTNSIGFIYKLADYDPSLLVWKKSSPTETKSVLNELALTFKANSGKDWGKKDEVDQVISPILAKYEKGNVLWPLRVALTGLAASPGPWEVISVLPKEVVLERLNIASNKIANLN